MPCRLRLCRAECKAASGNPFSLKSFPNSGEPAMPAAGRLARAYPTERRRGEKECVAGLQNSVLQDKDRRVVQAAQEALQAISARP